MQDQEGRTALRIACGLLALSMVPLLIDFAYWREPEPADPVLFVIAILTALIAWWASRGGRVGSWFAIVRAVLQVLLMGLALSSNLSRTRWGRNDAQLVQSLLSLGTSGIALVLLLLPSVRRHVRADKAAEPRAERPPSRLGSPRVLGALALVALVVGGIEQQVLYLHLSASEWLLRALYLLLPWAGAWLFARRGRDRAWLTVLGALAGEILSEQLSALTSGAEAAVYVVNVLFPVGSLPALCIGVPLALLAPRGRRRLLLPALALGQLLYRHLSMAVHTYLGHSGSLGDALVRIYLSWQAVLLSVAFAVLAGLVIVRLRLGPPASFWAAAAPLPAQKEEAGDPAAAPPPAATASPPAAAAPQDPPAAPAPAPQPAAPPPAAAPAAKPPDAS